MAEGEKNSGGWARNELVRDLGQVLNRYCVDNDHNTPDFVLAEYLVDCLDARLKAKRANEKWHHCELPRIGSGVRTMPEEE